MEGKETQAKTWVVLVPLPFQGHITPMLELGTVLHSKGFSIIVILNEFNAPNPLNYPDFLFMPLTFNTNCEDSIIDFANMKILALVLDINVKCKAPLKEILVKMMDQLKPNDRLSCLIHDNMMNFCEDVASDLNLPSIMLRTYSATSSLACLKIPKLHEEGLIPLEENMLEKPLEDLYPLRFKDLPIFKDESLEEVIGLAELANRNSTSPSICNTFEHIEHESLKKLQQHHQVPFFVVGPMHKIIQSTKTSSLYEEDRSCISWLDKQATNSVLYVSFGSLSLMDEKSLAEMAWGLSNSDQSFLWVVRPGSVSGSEGIEMLPSDVKEKIGQKGHIVKWAPQKEVLAHRAVGGFLSHCGWNSTIESISEGVPMICYPFFGDQMANARCVTDVWGTGLELEQGIERGKVEVVVRRLMVTEEGKGIRQRAVHLKEKADDSLGKGGSSFNALEELVKLIRNC